jgi:hypothetical protein
MVEVLEAQVRKASLANIISILALAESFALEEGYPSLLGALDELESITCHHVWINGKCSNCDCPSIETTKKD